MIWTFDKFGSRLQVRIQELHDKPKNNYQVIKFVVATTKME